MEQEEKELLLKDLYARFPYGVKIIVKYDWFDDEPEPYDTTLTHRYLDKIKSKRIEILPYLRPMSSMTDEEFKEWRYLYLPLPHNNEATETERRIDWLNAHHFDYRGLIEKGLAIEAPEGMYEI